MRPTRTPAVAASSETAGDDGVREPAGEVHAWLPGQNQTLCGLPLSRTRLRRFPHVPFDYSGTDQLTAADPIGRICPRCPAAAGGPGDRRRQGWERHSPRP